nr:uncharacterized protein LOC109156274 [Ipomoea trifida]
MSTPATTSRSHEDQDLLERSTKKTKRGREPTWAGQWRNIAVTPSHAWQTKDSKDTPVVEEVSDDDEMEDDMPDPNYQVVPVTKEEKERICRPWRRSLIIQILGRKVSYSYLLQRLQRMWKP